MAKKTRKRSKSDGGPFIETFMKEILLSSIMVIVLAVTLFNNASITSINEKVDMLSASLDGTETGDAKEADAKPTEQEQPSQPSQPTETPRTEVSADDDAFKGSADAPVTIIEFSDFQCSFCARFFSQTLPQLQTNYIDTGKVKFVFRDFPLGFHAEAQKAAEAAECAGDQGKFWEMHDKLFENYASLNVANMKQWASDLGLDTATFNDCLDSGKYESEVKSDMQDGQNAGISGTPSFFINGIKVVGAQPYSTFQQIIEAELAG